MYITHKVQLTDGQVASLRAAVNAQQAISLRLSAEQARSSSGVPLMLTQTQAKHLQKARTSGKGAELSLSKSQIEAMKRQGGLLPFIPLLIVGGIVAGKAAAVAGGGAAIKGIVDKVKGGRLYLGPPRGRGLSAKPKKTRPSRR